LSDHYVDNKQLYAVIMKYKADEAEAREKGLEKPRIPDYVGRCILLIANRLSTKPNFVNYSYRDEMVSDGIENCISYFDNFNPAKSDNPFAYFTQIIYFAFLRRIQKEKKQIYIRHKTLEEGMWFNNLTDEQIEDSDFVQNVMGYEAENVSSFIKAFEENMDKKKSKRSKRGIDMFIEDSENADSSSRSE